MEIKSCLHLKANACGFLDNGEVAALIIRDGHFFQPTPFHKLFVGNFGFQVCTEDFSIVAPFVAHFPTALQRVEFTPIKALRSVYSYGSSFPNRNLYWATHEITCPRWRFERLVFVVSLVAETSSQQKGNAQPYHEIFNPFHNTCLFFKCNTIRLLLSALRHLPQQHPWDARPTTF